MGARFVFVHLHALLRSLGAAGALTFRDRGQPFDALVERQREGRRFGTAFRDPLPYLRVAIRALPWLPPRGMGACMKRSLVLLDLWSRCGLEPELHIGVRVAGTSSFQAHAWLTARAVDDGELSSGDGGHEATFTFWPPVRQGGEAELRHGG